jgi:hypothetical protein
MPTRHLCIHGHFYQPPREDPFTGLIPFETGAEPYPNWNEKIHAECYRPNAEKGNFGRISFNIGPTLLEWMQENDPATVQMIVAQDQTILQKYGVGNAMAQAYNHTILPLATRADKVTQLYWGIVEFETRFGHKPLGMWLPETAVDLETLTVLSELGIQYTILAPWQAEPSGVDPTEAYRVDLPNHKSIAAFFYHQGLSTGISFEPALTSNADHFAKEVLANFLPAKVHRSEPQLLIIASDGELYGHHQKFRDHFLAHLANGASSHQGVVVSYPAVWLKDHPPRQAVKIRENTSWSCLHGVIRWMGQCDCTPGDGRWKIYFRQALNRLASEMDLIYADLVWPLGIDPWKLRNAYIDIILKKTAPKALINRMFFKSLSQAQVHQIALMLQAQYERQKMFASCGWFHEDFSRIEPKNNLAYAARAVCLVRQAAGIDLSAQLSNDMRLVVSHRTGLRGDVLLQHLLEKAEALGLTADLIS